MAKRQNLYDNIKTRFKKAKVKGLALHTDFDIIDEVFLPQDSLFDNDLHLTVNELKSKGVIQNLEIGDDIWTNDISKSTDKLISIIKDIESLNDGYMDAISDLKKAIISGMNERRKDPFYEDLEEIIKKEARVLNDRMK